MIDITVEFSDELLLDTSGGDTLPTLPLNNGGEAELVGGTGTREWLFSYTFPEEAVAAAAGAVAVLDIADDSVPVTIGCTGDCRASNWNGVTADLSVRNVFLSLSNENATMSSCAQFPSGMVCLGWGEGDSKRDYSLELISAPGTCSRQDGWETWSGGGLWRSGSKVGLAISLGTRWSDTTGCIAFPIAEIPPELRK